MHRPKRIIRVVAALIVVLGAVVAILFWRSGSVEDWIGSQLQLIANSHLNPQVSFTDLRYTYPNQVSLKNFRLVADDPAQPGKKIDIIDCDNASISLAEVPSIGKPIVLEKIQFEKPVISVIAVKPGSEDFVGFSQLLRKTGAPSQSDSAAKQPMKLSDLLRMRQVQLNDGEIVYDPRIAGTVPMRLDKIATTLDFAPAETGWYKLGTHISRAPLFDLRVAGLLNLDTFSVKDIGIELLTDLGAEKLDYLPPELQRLLKQYDARGKLAISISGSMPVMEPLSGNISAHVKLEKTNFAMGAYRIPLDNLEMDAQLADGKLMLPRLHVEALNGSADVTASVTLNERRDARLHVAVAQMQLNQLLADRTRAVGTTRLDGELNFSGAIMEIFGKVPMSGAPAEASLDYLRLSTDDPRTPGKTIDVLACDHAAVTLASALVGGPIAIDGIVLEKPHGSIVAMGPNSPDIAGISDLRPLVGQTMQSSSQPADGPATATSPALASHRKFSDLIRVGRVQISDAGIVYDPRMRGTDAMNLDPINITLEQQSAGASADDYKFSMKIAHKPAFDMSASGIVDLDAMRVDGFDIHLLADASQDKLDYLLPQVQLLLKQYKSRGMLNVSARGAIAFADPFAGPWDVNIGLGNASANVGDQSVPVEEISIVAHAQDGKLIMPTVKIAAPNCHMDLSASAASVDGDLAAHITGDAAFIYDGYRIGLDHIRLPIRYHDRRVDLLPAAPLGGSMINALDGTADLTGYIGLDRQLNSNLDLRVSGMMLQRLAVQSSDPTVAQLAGRLDTAIHVQAPLMLVIDQVRGPQGDAASQPAPISAATPSTPPPQLPGYWGNGTLNLTHARLVSIPVIDSLTTNLARLFTQQKEDAPNDRVELTYTLTGDHADFSSIHYVGGVLGVRGKGIITLAQSLDVTVKAGPIEKLEAFCAPGIQNVIDLVSDVLITYHIAGTLKNPSVTVVAGKSPVLESVLASGAHVVKQGVVVGAQKAGEGINAAGHLIGKLFRGGN